MANEPIEQRRAKDLDVDEAIYPRGSGLNEYQVDKYARALKLGATLPPLWVMAGTNLLTDGAHRRAAHMKAFGDDVLVPCVLKAYADRQEAFLESVAVNNQHGLALTPFDHTHCIQLAIRMQIPEGQIRSVLTISEARHAVLADRTALKPDGTPQALKSSMAHLAHTSLSPAALQANRAAGRYLRYHANQLIVQLRADTVRWDDAGLLVVLRELHGLLGTALGNADWEEAAV